MKILPRYFSSIFSVNLLYLVTILLNLVLGSWMQSMHFIWGLIASEVLLFLLPTIAYLRLRRIPLTEGLRLKPIRPLIGLLCISLGFTTYLFVVIIDAIMAKFTTIPIMPVSIESVVPKGTLESIGLFLAMAVVAPLCEEPLFRGAIQGAYEKQHTPSSAIAIAALMFAFWHFQLTGLWGLLLVAFILGYVALWSGSIYASILVHFGLNATSAANTLLALNTRRSGRTCCDGHTDLYDPALAADKSATGAFGTSPAPVLVVELLAPGDCMAPISGDHRCNSHDQPYHVESGRL
jgi:membrane protease YdiL (CAAX protease family)